MKTKILFSILVLLLSVRAICQNESIVLTFEAEYKGTGVPLDHLYVENLTQGGDITLISPDTVLNLIINGISSHPALREEYFSLSQNRPNPFMEQTVVSIFLHKADHLQVSVMNLLGQKVASYENSLATGNHLFLFNPGTDKYYILSATVNGLTKAIKMVSLNSHSGKTASFTYQGPDCTSPEYKSIQEINDLIFSTGDILRFTGYSNTPSGTVGTDVLINSPEVNTLYTFDITEGLRCPGTPTIEDMDGNSYKTVRIGTQCWMQENLKTTTYRNGTSIPNVTDSAAWSNLTNGAYVWYDNDISMKDLYGALYNWYSVVDTNGLCPAGWHVPNHDEWTAFTDFIGGINAPHGNELKSCRQVDSPLEGDCSTDEHPRWNYNTVNHGTDDYGFSGLPSGSRYQLGNFDDIGIYETWWSSTEYSSSFAWSRYLAFDADSVLEFFYDFKRIGSSVRCLRDEGVYDPIELTFNAVNNNYFIPFDSIKVMNSTQGVSTTVIWPDTSLTLINDFSFIPGDEMLYIGYTNGFQSGILDSPEESTSYTFQFATNIPCPGTPTVDYAGQTYNTIQVFSQCWLKENLNVGVMINGAENMTDNDTIEKYCYLDEESSCDNFGGLYQWNEMMQYTTQQGTQGICPPGWHLPTDAEWKVLDGAVDSQFGIGDPEWDDWSYRGYDAGTNLKTTSGWSGNGNGTDLYGFSGLSGGYRHSMGFNNMPLKGSWWSSSEATYYRAWLRTLSFDNPGVDRDDLYKTYGYSVRCLRDE